MENIVDIYIFFNEDMNKKIMDSKNVTKYIVEMLVRKRWGSEKKYVFETIKSGKPIISNFSSCNFSISYKKTYSFIVALSNKKIGVDIEEIKSVNEKILLKLFTKEEQNYVNGAVNDELKVRRFFEIWTLKEAYVKYLGCGINNKFRKIDVLKMKKYYYTESFEIDNSIISFWTSK